MKLSCEVIDPWEAVVGDDAIGRVVLHEELDGFSE